MFMFYLGAFFEPRKPQHRRFFDCLFDCFFSKLPPDKLSIDGVFFYFLFTVNLL